MEQDRNLPTAVPVGPGPAGGQNFALFLAVGCVGLAFTTLCTLGVGAALWGALRSGGGFASEPTVHLRGHVTSYLGSSAVPIGSSCELPIEQATREDASTWCHVRLTCNGVPLYGGEDDGYFPCTFSSSSAGAPGRVNGQDLATTTSDGDAAFTVNTDLRTFEAHDDGTGSSGFFVVTGTITTIE